MYKNKRAFIPALLLLAPIYAAAQHAGVPPDEIIDDMYPGKAYSPYAQRAFPSHVYWGDTHLHTGLSLDAGLFGNILDHEDAYRLARGEEITSSTGLPVKLSRPLDWLVITDHSDMMDRCVGARRRLDRPRLRSGPAGVLLRARPRDPDAALVPVRQGSGWVRNCRKASR
ncbi:MAG: DUF3604 domain-containing protein [Woeseiaceae bacterium]|nr:DUF3604 domain-containing protein [Woeseiaceae bacterium]